MALTNLVYLYENLPYAALAPTRFTYWSNRWEAEYAGFTDCSGSCPLSYRPLLIEGSIGCCDVGAARVPAMTVILSTRKSSTGCGTSKRHKPWLNKYVQTWTQQDAGISSVIRCENPIVRNFLFSEWQQMLSIAMLADEVESIEGFDIDQTLFWDFSRTEVCLDDEPEDLDPNNTSPPSCPDGYQLTLTAAGYYVCLPDANTFVSTSSIPVSSAAFWGFQRRNIDYMTGTDGVNPVVRTGLNSSIYTPEFSDEICSPCGTNPTFPNCYSVQRYRRLRFSPETNYRLNAPLRVQSPSQPLCPLGSAQGDSETRVRIFLYDSSQTEIWSSDWIGIGSTDIPPGPNDVPKPCRLNQNTFKFGLSKAGFDLVEISVSAPPICEQAPTAFQQSLIDAVSPAVDKVLPFGVEINDLGSCSGC